MVVLEQDREGSRLVERRRREPVALAGLLFLALALVPILSEGAITPLRALTFLALALGAALCFVLGLPRARSLPLPETATTARLLLTGTSNIEGYAVEAVAPSGARRAVLSGGDPARVLTDGLALAATLGVPLEPGWGLARDALGVLRAPAGAALLVPAFAVTHRIVPDQAIGAGTALWAAAFIPGATVVLALSPARPAPMPTSLSLVLPALTALYALVVALWLLGSRETLTLESGRVARQRYWFRKPLGEIVEIAGVVGIYAVSPLRGPARHLLLATRTGPVAVPTDPQAGQNLSHYPGTEERAAGRAAE